MSVKPPELPPVPPGRSALSAFVPLERWARGRVSGARETAALRLAEASARSDALRDEGEERLREAVVEGEREAILAVQDQARDRVGEARRAVEAWIGEAEARFDRLVPEAIERLVGAAPTNQPVARAATDAAVETERG